MNVWITKYALTQGIYERDVTASHSPSMVCGPGLFEIYHVDGRDWHRTKESAIKRAERMRADKIASLKKSIAKIEKLKFA